MPSHHNINQKRARLEREICQWTGRLLIARTRVSTAEKRRYTLALRCLKTRVADLAKLNREQAAARLS